MARPLNISDNECAAMRLLKADGWTFERLMISFGFRSKRGIEYHVFGTECTHSNNIDYKDDKLQKIATFDLINGKIMGLSTLECNAIQLLGDEWRHKTLKMVFETNSSYFVKHKRGECCHEYLL